MYITENVDVMTSSQSKVCYLAQLPAFILDKETTKTRIVCNAFDKAKSNASTCCSNKYLLCEPIILPDLQCMWTSYEISFV